MDKVTYEYPSMSPKRGSAANQMSEHGAKKICLVCGDKALGYNFNAITCESCKAFFRRNALKQKAFKCPFREQCEITVLSRRFCQKCRLRKCLQVGMLTDLIMTTRDGEDGGNMKHRKRRRHRDSIASVLSDAQAASLACEPQAIGGQSVSPSAPQFTTPYPTLEPLEATTWNNTQNFYTIESQRSQTYCDWEKLNIPSALDLSNRNCGFDSRNLCITFRNPLLETACSRQNSKRGSYTSNSSSDNNSEPLCALDANVQHAQDILDEWSPTVMDFSTSLSALKLFRLEELLSANEIMAIPAGGPPISFADASIAGHMGEVCIRLCFRVSKRIQAFRSLLPNDQIILLKGAANELMGIRGLMVYQRHVDSWRPVGFPHRYLPLSCVPTRDALVRLYSLFPDEWRTNEPIMLCLSSILLFDPTRPNLQDVESVRIQHQFYHDLLKDYLKSVYVDGDAVYLRLCQLMDVLRKMLPKVAVHARVQLDPRDIEVVSVAYEWRMLESGNCAQAHVERQNNGLMISPIDE